MKPFLKMLLPILGLMIFFSGTAFALPEITAKSAILIDAESGRILYEMNAHERLPQASTTKMTTGLIALENAKLTKKIRIPDDFINPGESSIYLEPGETQTLEDLMYALFLKSANDSAEAIGIGVAGSLDKFIDMMNKRVTDLGLTDTNYVNPHGLHHEDHYSSAYDLAMIGREVLKHPELRNIIATDRYTLPWAGNEYQRVVYNSNKLLKTYPDANGLKTGYTRQAGCCLVGSATRNGMQLVAVVLNCNDMYNTVSLLLDYGFDHFQKKEFIQNDQAIKEIVIEGGKSEKIKVLAKKPLSIALTEEELSKVKKNIYLPEEVKAPIKKGQRLGTLVYEINDQISISTELVANAAVDKRSLFSYLWYKFISAII